MTPGVHVGGAASGAAAGPPFGAVSHPMDRGRPITKKQTTDGSSVAWPSLSISSRRAPIPRNRREMLVSTLVGFCSCREGGRHASMRKLSRFLPFFSKAVSHLGVRPRPAQVSPSGPRYFGRAFLPFSGWTLRRRPGVLPRGTLPPPFEG